MIWTLLPSMLSAHLQWGFYVYPTTKNTATFSHVGAWKCCSKYQICIIYEPSCPQTGAELLTRAKAVGADGPFGVVWTDVTLPPILLGKRWIRQKRAFVLWSEGMEDQTRDAAAGASFLWWLLFLFKATSVRAAGRDVAKHLNLVYLLFKVTVGLYLNK